MGDAVETSQGLGCSAGWCWTRKSSCVREATRKGFQAEYRTGSTCHSNWWVVVGSQGGERPQGPHHGLLHCGVGWEVVGGLLVQGQPGEGRQKHTLSCPGGR